MVTNFNRYAECCLVPLPVHKIEAANLRLGRMLEKKGSFPQPGSDAVRISANVITDSGLT